MDLIDVGSTVLTAYVANVGEADTFLAQRLPDTAWTAADEVAKTQVLNMATQAIDRLNFENNKTVDSQVLEFPRDGDTVVPSNIIDACILLSVEFLNGTTVNDLRNQADYKLQAYARVKTEYKEGNSPHYMAGIPSAEAWDLLKPYLRQSSITLNRIS